MVYGYAPQNSFTRVYVFIIPRCLIIDRSRLNPYFLKFLSDFSFFKYIMNLFNFFMLKQHKTLDWYADYNFKNFIKRKRKTYFTRRIIEYFLCSLSGSKKYTVNLRLYYLLNHIKLVIFGWKNGKISVQQLTLCLREMNRTWPRGSVALPSRPGDVRATV